MNTLPYQTGSATSVGDELGSLPATAPYATVGSTQELAQLIAMEMQRDIDARIDWSLQQRQPARRGPVTGMELGLILGSIGIAVPITAIAAAGAGLAGIIIVWLGLVIINVAWSLRR